MFSETKITEIYCMADDFCKEFASQQGKYIIEDKKHKHRNKPNRMSDSAIRVILILFHSGGFRCFKHYYQEYICKHLWYLFPKRVSYNRFVELEKEVLLVLTIFIKKVLLGYMHRNQLCRFHAFTCLPQPMYTDSQNLRRTCRTRKMFHEVILRI